jgi:hypothetical protein
LLLPIIITNHRWHKFLIRGQAKFFIIYFFDFIEVIFILYHKLTENMEQIFRRALTSACERGLQVGELYITFGCLFNGGVFPSRESDAFNTISEGSPIKELGSKMTDIINIFCLSLKRKQRRTNLQRSPFSAAIYFLLLRNNRVVLLHP